MEPAHTFVEATEPAEVFLYSRDDPLKQEASGAHEFNVTMKTPSWTDRGVAVPMDWMNPIAVAAIDEFHRVSPAWVSAGVTPNWISLIGGILCILAIIALWYDYLAVFAILFWVATVLDDFDGTMARTYGLTSDLGEKLDHWKDVVVVILLIAVILIRFTKRVPAFVLLIAAGLYLGALIVGEGCEIKARAEQKEKMGFPPSDIEWMANLCPPNVHPKQTRYVTSLTFVTSGCAFLLIFAMLRAVGKRNPSLPLAHLSSAM